MTIELPEQIAFAKRPVDDDPDAAVARQRKDAIFDLAVENVVGDLNEVERLGAHDPLDFAVPAPFRGGDPYIAEPSGGLHGEQRPQMLLPGEEIVDLQQIEARHAPESAGGFNLVRAAGARGEPDLVGRKRVGGPLSLLRPYPITFWDEPYMGEESIRRPPESKKARITCAQASRAIGSLPTLKVIQLPSPTTGSSSPVEGIGLPSTRACREDASCGRNSAEAAVPAKPRSSRRRLSGDICSIERSIAGAPSHDRGPPSDAPRCSCRAAFATLKASGRR